MQIDLSHHLAKCDHCALGKQTCTPVPKTREGTKATQRLERVYVDFCGPKAVTSHARNVYSMNLIDDYSGYVWSVPIQSKAAAFPTLQIWHKAVTVQTNATLRILITDNGELVSNSMHTWCQSKGINHQLTAPYTSAQNGRAERLHRTILRKARAMRLACNAPGFLWGEFCTTASYLTNLTAAKANSGQTPYELWFDHNPCCHTCAKLVAGPSAFNSLLPQRSMPAPPPVCSLVMPPIPKHIASGTLPLHMSSIPIMSIFLSTSMWDPPLHPLVLFWELKTHLLPPPGTSVAPFLLLTLIHHHISLPFQIGRAHV